MDCPKPLLGRQCTCSIQHWPCCGGPALQKTISSLDLDIWLAQDMKPTTKQATHYRSWQSLCWAELGGKAPGLARQKAGPVQILCPTTRQYCQVSQASACRRKSKQQVCSKAVPHQGTGCTGQALTWSCKPPATGLITPLLSTDSHLRGFLLHPFLKEQFPKICPSAPTQMSLPSPPNQWNVKGPHPHISAKMWN